MKASNWPKRAERVSKFIKRGDNVLDLGGNNGFFKETCQGKINKYCVVDMCPGLNPDYVVDFNTDPYPDIVIDNCVVVCVGLLEYINDPVRFLKEIRKYGEKLILTYLQIPFQPEWGRFHRYKYVDILKFLEESGWELKHIEPIINSLELIFICELTTKEGEKDGS